SNGYSSSRSMVSPRRVLVAFVAMALGCRGGVQPLDDVQRMAYGVKPAVVRVNAYATAKFVVRPDALAAVAAELRGHGVSINAAMPSQDEILDTGAGGSGSGFIVHPDGLILTCGHVVAPTRDAAALRKDLLRNGAIAALVKHLP